MRPTRLLSLQLLSGLALMGCDHLASTESNLEIVSAPGCPASAFPDDSISFTDATPGAKVFWRRIDNGVADTFRVDHRRIWVGDGWFQAFAVGPNDDTSEMVSCATSVEGGIAPPTILPRSGTFDYPIGSATIVSGVAGAVIHYTLDGSIPTSASPVYSNGIPVSATAITHIRAIAVPSVGHSSLSVSAGYEPLLVPWTANVQYRSIQDSRDGQTYPSVRIGSQTWMAKNLNYAPRSSNRSSIHGAYYMWDSLAGSGNSSVCPSGWHVPDSSEWEQLRAWLLSQPDAVRGRIGQELKAPASWKDSTATDRYGFRVLMEASGTTSFWSADSDAEGMAILAEFSASGNLELTRVPIHNPCAGDPSATNIPVCELYNQLPLPRNVRCLKDRE